MKRVLSLVLIPIFLFQFVACGTNNSDKPTTESTKSQSELTNQDDYSSSNSVIKQTEQSSDSTEKVKSETILTEFTVQIAPDDVANGPLNDPLRTFSLEIPKNWIAEENKSHQYVYYAENEDIYIAIIEGGRQVLNPENPFKDVYEVFPSTVSITEIDVCDYPVLRHITKATHTNASKDMSHYTYHVFVNDSLIMIELTAFYDSPQTQEDFDKIISSFKLKS